MHLTTHNAKPCAKCKGTGRDYTQRHQSPHGCAAHLNSAVCWSCKGTGADEPKPAELYLAD